MQAEGSKGGVVHGNGVHQRHLRAHLALHEPSPRGAQYCLNVVSIDSLPLPREILPIGCCGSCTRRDGFRGYVSNIDGMGGVGVEGVGWKVRSGAHIFKVAVCLHLPRGAF